MSCLLLLTSLFVGGVYHAEDFHYYDENLNPHGVRIVNKIYVEVNAEKKKQLVKFTEKLKDLESFKEIETDRLNGILLFFKNKEATFKGLDSCRHYNAFPVVMYDGIECVASNEIWVKLKAGVSVKDFISRLESVADGEFVITEFKTTHLLSVKNLVTPSNSLILANLIAKDSFWTEHAMIAWIPLDGYVKATASVETTANADLGEVRKLKLTIDVFDSDIKIRTDLLPQLGQGLVPFPYSGDLWFDVFDTEISEFKKGKKKTVVVTISFRQLQYGNFVFQPILVSYEKNKQLKTVKTNLCPYTVRSIITDTDIHDIQSRQKVNDLTVVVPEKPTMDVSKLRFYGIIRNSAAAVFLTLFNLLLLCCVVDMYNYVKVGETKDELLWKNLMDCRKLIQGITTNESADWRADYSVVSNKLNKVLTDVFGVSLYQIKEDECNSNFKAIVGELNKLYKSGDETIDVEAELLAYNLVMFCGKRTYKKES